MKRMTVTEMKQINGGTSYWYYFGQNLKNMYDGARVGLKITKNTNNIVIKGIAAGLGAIGGAVYSVVDACR